MTPFTKAIVAGMLASSLAACSSSDDDSSGGGAIDDRPGATTGSDDGTGTATAGTDTGAGTATAGTDTGAGTATAGTDTGAGTATAGTDTGAGTATAGTDTGAGTATAGTDTGAGTATAGTDTGAGTATAGTDTGGSTDGGTDTGGAPGGGDVEIGPFNRTVSEELSLRVGGPGSVDPSRTDEAPSAPTGLTALLVADDWIEIDWVPSVDDERIAGYTVYRDGIAVRTLDEEPDAVNPLNEARDLRTTTYIDCNYTKNPTCDVAGGVGRPGPGGSHVYQVAAFDYAGNQSELSAPARFALNTIDPNGSAPDLAAEGYVEVFADDFDSTSLDTDDNWVTDLSFAQFVEEGRAINGAQQYFVDTRGQDRGFAYDPFVFENGNLKITAARTPDALREAAGGQPYLSGAISTRSKVGPFEYGYAEMRAKVPSGDGLLSTFFLFQPAGNQYEIDILEYLGREPDGATQNYHYRDGFRFEDTGFGGVPHASPTMFLNTGEDLSADFHTYSVLWEPGLIVYYIDEREVRRLSGPRVADVPMDLVLQLVVGTPNFAGDPSNTPFPVAYEIDYVRVFQKP